MKLTFGFGIFFLFVTACVALFIESAISMLFPALIIILGLFILPIIFYKKEELWYGDGKCPKCGGKLVNFYTSFDGTHGYCCENDARHYHNWLGWFDPEKNKNKNK